MSSHILLTYVTKAAPFAGRLVMPGDPEDEAGDYDPERPIARGKVRVFDQPGRSAQWRKKKDFAKVAFIRTRPAAWVLGEATERHAFSPLEPRERPPRRCRRWEDCCYTALDRRS